VPQTRTGETKSGDHGVALREKDREEMRGWLKNNWGRLPRKKVLWKRALGQGKKGH